MADLDNDRTVVVERDTRDVTDTRDASSPLGWVILLVALLLLVMFFFTNGFGLFGDGNTDTTDVQAPATSETFEDNTTIQNDQDDQAPTSDTNTDMNSDTTTEPTTEPTQ